MFSQSKHRKLGGRVFIGLPSLLLILTLLVACGDSAQKPPTPTPTTLQFSTLDLHIPQQALNAPIVGTVPDTQKLHVSISFKVNQAALDQLGKTHKVKTNDTTSANDLAHNLGIDDATYKKIQTYFGVENATLKLSKTRTNLTVDAQAGSFARLLQTRFVTHTLNNRSFFTPDPNKPPKVPTFLASSILAVTGLDNYSLAPQRNTVFAPQYSQHTATTRQANADCNVDSQVVVPGDIAHVYGYDQLWRQGWHGENMTVNLVEIDGFDQNDISNYANCVKYRGKLEYANIDGEAPAPGGEATLDIDMLMGLASSVHIVDYQTDISQLKNFADAWVQINDALQQIINNNADNPDSGSVVSISLGLAEEYMTPGNIAAIDQSLQILTKGEHMTVFIASGDCGAFTNHVYNSLSVSFPASDTYAVAVGGTILGVDGRGNRAGEVVWSDGADRSKCHNQWGSGGGVSTYFARPNWQSALGTNNRYSNGKRQLPDISAIAYDLPVYFQGQWISVGGTSAAAPIWAAGMMLMNQGLINREGAFYYGPDIFYGVANAAGRLHPYYDIKRGTNLFYQAVNGWDFASGLGSPNLPDFFTILDKSLQ